MPPQNYTPNLNYSPAGQAVASSIGGGVIVRTNSGSLLRVPGRGGGGGGGGSSRASNSFVPASFVDPRIQRSNELAGQRQALESQQAGINARVAALNTASRLQSLGLPIPGSIYQTLGISRGQPLSVARASIESQRNSFTQNIGRYNTEAQEYNISQVATPAEISARASLLDRGARVQSVNLSRSSRLPEKGSLPEKLRKEMNRASAPQDKGYLGDVFLPLTGETRTGIPFVTATGSIGQRGSKTLLATAYEGKRIGGNILGAPGAAAGSLIGTGAGLFFGAVEGFSRTAGQITGRVSERATGSPLVGEVVQTGTEFITFPGTSLKFGGLFAKTALKSAPAIPRALGFAENLAQRGKSIYATETIFGRAAKGSSAAIKGFEAGLSGVGTSLLYSGKAERIGRTTGEVLKAGKNVLKNPFIKYPATGGFALASAPLAQEVAIRTSSPGLQSKINTPQGDRDFRQFFENVRQTQASKGVVSQIGGELGLGARSDSPLVGGVTTAEVQQAARVTGFNALEAKELERIYRTTQVGALAGQTSLSIFTELGGNKLIGPIVTKGLTGKAVGLGGKEAFKETVKVVRPTITRFALFGAIEGVGSTAISDFATGRARSLSELPKRVQTDPFKYFVGGAAGAVSAPVLGGLAIGGGIFKAFRGGKSIRGAGTEIGATYGGYFTDLFEKTGDDFAKVFGKTEPSFRIRTIQGLPTLTTTTEEQTGKKGKTSTRTTNLFGIGTKTNIGTRTNNSFIEAIPTLTNQPGPSTPQPNLITNFTGETNQPNPFSQNNLVENFNENLNENVNINTVVNFNTPIGVPVSKAGFPPFFPASPFGEGEGGRGGRGSRKTYLNEYAFATGLLGRPLARQGRRVSREKKSLFQIPKAKKASFFRSDIGGIRASFNKAIRISNKKRK